jgi:uncharacterized protein
MDSKQLQKKFSDFIRHGHVGDFPEVNEKMLTLYHEHLKSKLSRLLSGSFTLTEEALGLELWEQYVRNFLANQSASGEAILSLSQAFYDYLITKETPQHPYLKDLVTFEYLLLELFYLEDIPSLPFQPVGNRLESPVVINPEHHFLSLNYPVFKYPGSELVQRKGSYYLLLYRHPTSFNVQIIELSALYFSALSMMAKQSVPLLPAIEQAAYDLNMDQINIEEIITFFDSLHEQGVILGFHYADH